MPDSPLALKRLAAIRELARYYTDNQQELAAEFAPHGPVFIELLDELDYRQEQTRQVLQELLSDEHLFNANDFKAGINHERKLQNKAIRLAAQKLGLTLD